MQKTGTISFKLKPKMIKYFISILLTALLAFISGLYLPWWGIAIAAFIVGVLIPQKPFYSFLSGFIGVFLLWEILAWRIDSRNNGILSQKIAQILPLGGSTVLLILITSLVGALVGGLAAWAASYIQKKNQSS
ncbi:MAG TPA: hypothetical protein VMH01_10410 [Puia sp.]|nr:hypothetical protein [Puia sp.]